LLNDFVVYLGSLNYGVLNSCLFSCRLFN